MDELVASLRRLIEDGELHEASAQLTSWRRGTVVDVLERLDPTERAIAFRLLAKDRALRVFEDLDAPLQGEVVKALRTEEVNDLFGQMDPDDRVGLLDELPASLAARLLSGLSPRERQLTATVLGYRPGSIGRAMTPEFVTLRPELTAEQALTRVRAGAHEVETIYALPVVDDARRLIGMVGLRGLLVADPATRVEDLMNPAEFTSVSTSAERAARQCADDKLLVLPVVDAEERIVGILTVDDALQILEDAESEDAARQGGVEPLRRPYPSTPVLSIVRSRVVWLLVLAVGATLTVQVLEVFEATLSQMVVLSLFIPLLIGTGGNTGNQAATTVTRALALGDLSSRDVLFVIARELRVGIWLGALLGALGFLAAGLVYGWDMGAVIGLSLLGLCTMAATVGGVMPLVANALRADPAVFSNPFITTFIDAAGLVLYFLVAKAVLGI